MAIINNKHIIIILLALIVISGSLPSCAPDSADKPPVDSVQVLDSDGDGWTDEQEQAAGTNPYNTDTDDDGYWDAKDPNPLDPDVPTRTTTTPTQMVTEPDESNDAGTQSSHPGEESIAAKAERFGRTVVCMTDGLLADFEPEGITPVKVPASYIDPQEAKVEVYLDEGASGTEHSLCMEFELPAEYLGIRILDFLIVGDITPYEGLAFSVKIESEEAKAPIFGLLLTEHGPFDPPEDRPVEVWSVHFQRLGEEWTRVVAPFTAFELHDQGRPGVVNRIFDLSEVDYFHTNFTVEDWKAGDKVKVWLDEIRFYKKGEFEPTTPDRGTAVSRKE